VQGCWIGMPSIENEAEFAGDGSMMVALVGRHDGWV
jgi:hypothetical protein